MQAVFRIVDKTFLNQDYLFKYPLRSVWHAVRFPIQSRLVLAFPSIPRRLACIGVCEEKKLGKERSERTVYPRISGVMCLSVDGSFCYFYEFVDLCSQKLACDSLAHLFCSDTFWLSTA